MSASIQSMVRDDLLERERLGKERYGTALFPHNGRSALRDAYEEALDLACYLRQALEETVDAPRVQRSEPGGYAEPAHIGRGFPKEGE